MKTIYKYKLADMEGTLKLPKGAKFLSVQTQPVAPALYETEYKIVPHLWALVDSDAKKVSYDYKLIGTGWEIEDGTAEGYEFIGTVQIPSNAIGLLVFHLFMKQSK